MSSVRSGTKIALCLLTLTCAGCAAFQGNTRKKFGDFDIDERQQYQHHLNERAAEPERQDREILKRLEKEDTRTKAPSRAKRESSLKDDGDRPWLSRILRRLFRIKD